MNQIVINPSCVCLHLKLAMAALRRANEVDKKVDFKRCQKTIAQSCVSF